MKDKDGLVVSVLKKMPPPKRLEDESADDERLEVAREFIRAMKDEDEEAVANALEEMIDLCGK